MGTLYGRNKKGMIGKYLEENPSVKRLINTKDPLQVRRRISIMKESVLDRSVF